MILQRLAAVGAGAVLALAGAAFAGPAHADAGTAAVTAKAQVVQVQGIVHPMLPAGCSVSYSTHTALGYCNGGGGYYYGQDYYVYVQACNVDGCEYFKGSHGLVGETTSVDNVGSNWFVESGTAWFAGN